MCLHTGLCIIALKKWIKRFCNISNHVRILDEFFRVDDIDERKIFVKFCNFFRCLFYFQVTVAIRDVEETISQRNDEIKDTKFHLGRNEVIQSS